MLRVLSSIIIICHHHHHGHSYLHHYHWHVCPLFYLPIVTWQIYDKSISKRENILQSSLFSRCLRTVQFVPVILTDQELYLKIWNLTDTPKGWSSPRGCVPTVQSRRSTVTHSTHITSERHPVSPSLTTRSKPRWDHCTGSRWHPGRTRRTFIQCIWVVKRNCCDKKCVCKMYFHTYT